MNKVICFGMCDKNYLDPLRVMLCTFNMFNADVELKVFLVDDNKEFFDSTFNYPNVEFINFGKATKTYTYINQHFDDFKTFSFAFTKTHTSILNVTIANEVTDYMYEHYGKDYQVIMRLDFDVLFSNSILPSIDNFLASGKALGGAEERKHVHRASREFLHLTGYDGVDKYLNAGNFMYRTDKMYHDQFDRMCNLFETKGFDKFHYFDQDSVNLMYADEDKYDNINDGYFISCVPMQYYLNFIRKRTAPILLHYVGAVKPWTSTKKYKNLNFNLEMNYFHPTFPTYLAVAKHVNCSDEFIKTIQDNYAEQCELATKTEHHRILSKSRTGVLFNYMFKQIKMTIEGNL